jgi:ATP-dependent Lon protease
VRSRAKELGLEPSFFDKTDIHLHIPAGAQPKDGPSAGVTMATALVSLVSGRPVKPDVGMTGEITLRGQVLPIGGVKEKVLAAHRSCLTTVILPRRNEADLEDLPEEVRNTIKFIFVETVDDVLQAALEPVSKTADAGLAGGPTDGKPARKSRKKPAAGGSSVPTETPAPARPNSRPARKRQSQIKE